MDNFLQHLEDTDANTNDSDAKEEGQQGICGREIPNQANGLRDDLGSISKNTAHGDSRFSR